MGLLKHLLFWPVTGPMFLIDFSLRRVEGVVREELTDVNTVTAELMELQLLLEIGDIDDAEYARREAELMQRLREIREWRESFGMGVTGGLVQVARGGETDVTEIAPADPSESGESGDEAESRPPVADPRSASVDFELDRD
jgi:hypothetical protein